MNLKEPYAEPLKAAAVEGDVVITSPISGAFSPEAVLASLDELREAAEQAIRQRELGTPAPTP